MPDYLKFWRPKIFLLENGRPSIGTPFSPPLEPNILPNVSSCLYASSKIDQYGHLKVYATCTGTEKHNFREYPPLYSGDVFPVLDQLYYFESGIGSVEKPHKAIKVIQMQGFKNAPSDLTLYDAVYRASYPHFSKVAKEHIVLPLTPIDFWPNHRDNNPFNPQAVCRNSELLGMGRASVVQIRPSRQEPSLLADIFTDNNTGYADTEDLVMTTDSFQTKKTYRIGDIVICHYKDTKKKSTTADAPQLAVGFKITKIVPPDPERNRVFQTVEGEKTGRLIGWVELDPTPIPIDANGNPITNPKPEEKP